MVTREPEKSTTNVCNLKYLTEMMGSKKHLIKEIMDTFLEQIPEELESINNALPKADYSTIKNFSHTMKSSVSIMGISLLTPVLQEMEDIATKAIENPNPASIERIKELNEKLNLICAQAIKEIESEKANYSESI